MQNTTLLNPCLEENLSIILSLVKTHLKNKAGIIEKYTIFTLLKPNGQNTHYLLTHSLVFSLDPEPRIDIIEPNTQFNELTAVVRSIIIQGTTAVFNTEHPGIKKYQDYLSLQSTNAYPTSTTPQKNLYSLITLPVQEQQLVSWIANFRQVYAQASSEEVLEFNALINDFSFPSIFIKDFLRFMDVLSTLDAIACSRLLLRHHQLINQLKGIKIPDTQWSSRCHQLANTLTLQLSDQLNSTYAALFKFMNHLELVFDNDSEPTCAQLLPLIKYILDIQLELPFNIWFADLEEHMDVFNQHFECSLKLLDLYTDLDHMLTLDQEHSFLADSFLQSCENWLKELCYSLIETQNIEEILTEIHQKKQLVYLLTTYIYANLQTKAEDAEEVEPELDLPNSIYCISAIRLFIKQLHFDNPKHTAAVPKLFASMGILALLNQMLNTEDSCFKQRYSSLKAKIITELMPLVAAEATEKSTKKIHELFKHVEQIIEVDSYFIETSLESSIKTIFTQSLERVFVNKELTKKLYDLITPHDKAHFFSLEFNLKKLSYNLKNILGQPELSEREFFMEFQRFYEDPENYESLQLKKAMHAHLSLFYQDTQTRVAPQETPTHRISPPTEIDLNFRLQ